MSTPIPSLADWLNTATDDLSPLAQERIKLEITSHFECAVESHQAEGLTEDEAQARALTDLGDATAAAKRFRRSHLTEWEANYFENAWKLYYRRWGRSSCMLGLIFCGYLFCVVVAYQVLKTRFNLMLVSGFLMIGMIYSAVSIWISYRHGYRARPRLLLTLDLLYKFGVFALLYLYGRGKGYLWIMLISALLGSSVNLTRRIRLWFKLQRIGDVCQELTPPGAPAS